MIRDVLGQTGITATTGMGTVHDGYGEGLQAGKQQLQQRTDAAIGLRLQKSACGGAGDS